MNRLVTRLSALAIASLCATSAAARTVSVASVGESAAALAFGDADGKTCEEIAFDADAEAAIRLINVLRIGLAVLTGKMGGR